MAIFEVGKSYTHTVLVRDSNGNKSTRTEIYTITKRTPCYVTFYHIAWSGSKMPHGRCKILTAEPFGEYIHLGVLSGYLYAENIVNDDSQPEAAEMPATAEITPATDNDNALASQPASVASSQSETNDDAKSLLDADYFKGKSIDEIKRAFSPASLKQLKGFALCYTIPYFNRMNKKQLIDAIASKISLILEERKGYMTAENVTGDNGYAQQDDIIITATKPRTIPEPVRVKFIPGTVYAGNDSGNHFPVKITARNADFLTTDFIGAYIKNAKIQTIAGVEHAVFPMQYRNIEIWADKPELPEPVQSKTSTQHEITQPDNLYDDGSFSDAPGDNSECARNQDFPVDIPERREPDSIPADNPGFTVVPHDRMHITRPDYTVYPDAIHDNIPCVNVPACETLTLASDAVNPLFSLNFFFAHCLFLFRLFCASLHSNLIPYMLRDSFTEFYPSHVKDFYADKNHFPAPFLLPCPRCGSLEKPVFAHRFYFDNVTNNLVEMLIVNCPHCGYTENSTIFSAKQDHSYSCYWGNDTKAAITLAENWNSCGLRKQHKKLEAIHICPPRSKYFNHARKLNKMKLDACSDFQSLFSLILTLRAEKILSQATYMRFKLTSSDNAEALARELAHAIIQRREKSTPVHAEINDITPVKDWDKIIADNTNSIINFDYDDFKHVKHAGKIHDRINSHNYALVNACESLDDIRMLLAGVSKPALIGIMRLTADYFGTCGDYHEKEMDNIPHMIDSLIERIDYCRKDKAYWTQLKQEKSQTEQAQPKTRKPNPAPASDIEHKLIETKDLHFSEKRDALDHNAAVISSCMFHEAIVSMLLKISPAAIFQLGMHMGLFIAKPKGKKIVIAEAFAKRLIEHRELHAVKFASVHTHTAQHTSNNTAGIPHNVKFFETKHGQLTFIEPKDRQLYFVFTD